MPVTVAVDAMGGDHAPGAIVRGAVQALAIDSDLELVLVGEKGCIEAELAAAPLNGHHERVRVVHASDVVPMDAPAVQSVRAYKGSSLARMVSMAAAGEVDAVVSAGNTGAFAAASQLMLKPLPSVTRPGIAVTIPAFHGPFVLCDVGANIQAKPHHLREYAVMATLYAQRMLGIESPRSALVSIGEESGKGTGLVRQAHELLQGDGELCFVGNVEGRELFEDRCDVAVCDGFVGNITLKFAEGLAAALTRAMAREFNGEAPALRSRFHEVLDRFWRRHDYSQFGGAPLLGINGVCMVCHGRSNEFALRNAVSAARRFVEQGFNDAITARLARSRR